MANRTDTEARALHGTNPQFLVPKIMRERVYSMTYWKDECMGLNEETLIDRLVEIDHICGSYGANRRPGKFLCLLLKTLQIQPSKDIVHELIQNEDFKYVSALGAFYARLAFHGKDVYEALEPLLNSFVKLRKRGLDGSFSIIHMDEFVDALLHDEEVLGIPLPRLVARRVLEETGQLEPRMSVLQDEFEFIVERERRRQGDDERPMRRRKQRKHIDDDRVSHSSSTSHRHGESKTVGEGSRPRDRKRGGESSISIEETNAIRESLGLKPLKE